jgi:hypothetical protein
MDAFLHRADDKLGTNPQSAVAIDGTVPQDADRRPLDYMALERGQPLEGTKIDAAFIGSCTNSRISDLSRAAELIRGGRWRRASRRSAFPGSTSVKREAEALGLDRIFIDAGFEWRESGCSMCFYAGGESFAPGSRVVSSTNRNFEGRQGPGIKTHIASPRRWSQAPSRARSPIPGALRDERVRTDHAHHRRRRSLAARQCGYRRDHSLAGDEDDRQDRARRRALRRLALFGAGRPHSRGRISCSTSRLLSGAKILLGGSNFGSGSSREHAVWALAEYGFRAVVAASFAPIFRGNCIRNGIVPAQIEKEDVVELAAAVAADPRGNLVTIDVARLCIGLLTGAGGVSLSIRKPRRCSWKGSTPSISP